MRVSEALWMEPIRCTFGTFLIRYTAQKKYLQKFYPIVTFAACFSLQRSMPMVFRGYHESAVWLNNSFDVIANAYRDVWLDIKLLNRCPRLERTSRVKKTLLSDRGRYSDIIRPQIGYVSQAKSLDQFMVLSELIRQICANLGEDGYAQCGSSGVVSNQYTIEAQHRAIKSTAVNNLHATTGHVLASTLPKFLVECTTDFGSDPIRHYESESEIVEKALNLCEDANHYKRHARKSQRGSTKDPTPSQDAPSQDAPVDDAESSEAKAASTSSPAKNLTLAEGKARAQAAKASSSKRADEGATKRAVPGSPTIAKGFRSLFDSSDEEEEEEAISEPQEISNDLDEQQERYQAAQLQGTPVPPAPVYPRGYYPPDAGSGSPMFPEHLKAPRDLKHGSTSRGTYERASVQDEPLFVNDIEAARCVLLAPHRIPLKEFTSLRKKPEDRSGLFPVWGYPWVQPENTTTQTQAEDLFWRWFGS
ncbi:LOW QUALITY PROTEIN: ATP-binding cassette (ABC) Superfamily [Phytophthora palmivora]|uniref:ATP-binding cassette (ABC) Superfamily n=1 Tax=Phytophthora palmivora TaxID=4796 RepID=A0A2P4X637_9STRA|nr:LOW QUALITY PROTEIN: ATP-binding cassette (ABC) Superfamily [Phytophthora palmivora]